MKRLFALFALGIAAVLLICWFIGAQLVAPQNTPIGSPPTDLPVQSVSFPSDSGAIVHGWLHVARIPEIKGNILLLHGIRSDRRSMLGRAKFLSEVGYNTLAIDLQSHGESLGKHITFGKLESLDTVAALNFLKSEYPNQPIGIIGTSLGGAAAILSQCKTTADAMVVESTFTTLPTATRNRLKIRFGAVGPPLSPLLLAMVPVQLGFDPDEVSPLLHIHRLHCPILILNGSDDQRTTSQEAQMLYTAAPDPKQLWIVQGAAHVDLHRFAGKEYEQRITSFLATHMKHNTNG